MIKWFKRVFAGVVILLGVAVASGIAFEQWSRSQVAREYKPVGQLIEVDGAHMHLNCLGNGAPTVVLESGLDTYGSLSWALVQPEIARTNRVCSYDRAGILWSERRDETPTASLIAERLHALLDAAAESPPYVMVGHSLGGPLIRVFADRYPHDVQGLIFVDSSHPDQTRRFPPEAGHLIRDPSPVVVRFVSATGVLRLRGSTPADGVPIQARLAEKFVPQSMPGLLGELAEIEHFFDAARGTIFGDLPIIVLSAGKPPEALPPEITQEIAAKISNVWSELQTEIAALSTNGEQRTVDDATHYIQWDNPGAVVSAIRDVLVQAQEPGEDDK